MVTSRKKSSAKASLNDKVSRELGESLVGTRIKVWWPLDRKFYEGVIDSFDSSRKKHKVLYCDGEVEKLDLTNERWEPLEEDDNDEPDEISLHEDSGNVSSEASPEPKKSRSNGKASKIGRTDEAVPKKKQKLDIPTTSKSPKPQTERNGIGGKIVAAASRMTRLRSKENGQEKVTPRSLRSSMKISESNSRKQKRPSSSSEAVSKNVRKLRSSSKKFKTHNSDDADEDDEDMSEDDSKHLRTSSKKMKRNITGEEDADGEKDVDESKGTDDDEEEEEEEEENDDESKPLRTSSKKNKSNKTDESEEEEEESDDDSKPLVSLLNKSPKVIEAIKKKMTQKNEEAADEGSSGNKEEAEEEKEAGEGGSGSEAEAVEKEEAGEGSSGDEEEKEAEGGSGSGEEAEEESS